MAGEVVYQATGLYQSFGAVKALQDVSVVLRSGEVHAILGANGAGKSTLMKILAGAEQPDRGELAVGGKPARFTSPQEAERAGIAWVAQELTLFGELDVLENLFLGREPRWGPLTNKARMRTLARPYLRRVGLDEDLAGAVGLLRLGERQRLEIARALMQEPRILILDEPTSALDARETERLLTVIRELRETGVSVILVSHFLEEVFATADVITVLRDGRTVLDAAPRSSLTQQAAIDAMLGERLQIARAVEERRRFGADDPTGESQDGLRIDGITVQGVLEPTTFRVSAGQIVAVAGLEGSGPLILLDVIYGQRPADAGTIRLPGGAGAPASIPAAVRAGVSFVPSDRGRIGLFADQSIVENIAVVRSLALTAGGMLLRPTIARDRADERIRQLQIKTSSPDLPVKMLSGGNQQKVVFAKWLEAGPRLYLLDDPTRGVDVGTRSAMHAVIRELADAGATVLIASSDLEELCSVADRAEVFFHGRHAGTIREADLTPHVLLEAINTGTVQAPAA